MNCSTIIKAVLIINLMIGGQFGLADDDGTLFLSSVETLSFANPRLAIDNLIEAKTQLSPQDVKQRFFINFQLLTLYIKIGDLKNISYLKSEFEQPIESNRDMELWQALAQALIQFTFLNTEQARRALRPYFPEFETTESQRLKMWSSFVIGILHAKKNQFEEALKHFNVASSLSVSLDDNYVKLATLKNLISVFYYMRDYDRAEEYSNQFLEKAKALEDEFFVAQALSGYLNILTMRVIALNVEINDLDEGSPEFEPLVAKRTALREQMTQIGENLLELTQRIGAYRDLARFLIARQIQHNQQSEFQKALELGDQIIAIATENSYNFEKAVALNNKALSYQLLGEHEKGIKELESAREIYEKIGNEQFRLWVLEDFAKAYERKGDFEQALDYRKKYHAATMNLMNETNSQLVIELQEEHEADRKKFEIEELRQANNLKKSEIENRRLQLIILVGVVFMMIVIVITQSSRHRAVQEKSRKLDLLNRQLRELSFRDPLTGLNNRRLMKEIEESIAANEHSAANDESPQPVGMVLLDIDHFKAINDQYGHDVGDLVLTRFSQLLRELTTEDDYLIRWGGEEFLLILPNRSYLQTQEFCENLLREAAIKTIHHANFKVQFTASVGYCSYPHLGGISDDITWQESIKLVDRLLYFAKETGRNRSVGFLLTAVADDAMKRAIFEKEVAELVSMEGVQINIYSPTDSDLHVAESSDVGAHS